MEGATIGQYRLVRTIGAGGMGVVYLAEHTLVGRQAAIKVLLPELSLSKDVVARFFNEARAMGAISDPGIVQMYDFGFHTDGCAYIVMELLEGEPLSRRLKRLKRFAPIDALRIVRQVAGSLGAAHAAGVVHRDLKPDNVFIVRDAEAIGGERAKVLDFGIAKLGGDTLRDSTLPGTVLGTPTYMSPEQCRGVGTLDARSDIYSLGCVMYFLIVGLPPFDHYGIGELISAHMNDQPQPPSARVENLPPGIDELLMRCLAKAPEARFQTMAELQQACDVILNRLSSSGQAFGPSQPDVALPPGFRSAPLIAPNVGPHVNADPPTTLSSAAVVTQPPMPRPRRTWFPVAIGLGIAVVAGVGIAIGMSGNAKLETKRAAEVDMPTSSTPATPAAAPDPVRVATPPPVVDAGVAVVDATIDAAPPAKKKPSTQKLNPKQHQPKSDDLYDDR
jgi:eukaryotic-like serine/threonine-protein kinase